MSVEYLTDVLRAEASGQDLYEDAEGYVNVLAMRKDGTLYGIGRVTGALVAQCPEVAIMVINRIKFGSHRSNVS